MSGTAPRGVRAGAGVPAMARGETRTFTLTEGDVLGPSEALRVKFGYAKVTDVRRQIERLAATNPTTLACMHGSAFRGDGAAVLRTLAKLLEGDATREV